MTHDIGDQHEVERVQHKATQMISDLIQDRLKQVELTSLVYIRRRCDVQVYNIINGHEIIFKRLFLKVTKTPPHTDTH